MRYEVFHFNQCIWIVIQHQRNDGLMTNAVKQRFGVKHGVIVLIFQVLNLKKL